MTDLRKLALELAEKTRQCAADGSELLNVESAILTGMRAALSEPDEGMLWAGCEANAESPRDRCKRCQKTIKTPYGEGMSMCMVITESQWNAMARVRADSLDH